MPPRSSSKRLAAVAFGMSMTAALPAFAEASQDEPRLTAEQAARGPGGLTSADPPVFRYATVYADEAGRTQVAHCALKGFALKSYAAPAAPQWLGIPPGDISSITYAVLPVGYVGAWHHAPGPQWVITLSGRWSVEMTDGTVLEQGPGEVQFNADMSARRQPPDGRIGHLTRTVGDAPNLQLIVSLKAAAHAPPSHEPCQPSSP